MSFHIGLIYCFVNFELPCCDVPKTYLYLCCYVHVHLSIMFVVTLWEWCAKTIVRVLSIVWSLKDSALFRDFIFIILITAVFTAGYFPESVMPAMLSSITFLYFHSPALLDGSADCRLCDQPQSPHNLASVEAQGSAWMSASLWCIPFSGIRIMSFELGSCQEFLYLSKLKLSLSRKLYLSLGTCRTVDPATWTSDCDALLWLVCIFGTTLCWSQRLPLSRHGTMYI